MRLTDHFSVEEMTCKCGCGGCKMEPSFMTMLEHYRLDLDMPLTVTSGYRCAQHNAKVGGKSGSYHLDGRAADLAWGDKDGIVKYHMLATAIDHGFRGMGISHSFLHIDGRDSRDPVLWFY